MKKFTLLTAIAILGLGLATTNLFAQEVEEQPADDQATVQHGPNFVDEDGDGFNDNAPDVDGDGVPNGQDEDYSAAGNQNGKGRMAFIDEDGDGLNDIAGDFDGDGVPNGLDPDFERGKMMQSKKQASNFVDTDGDGINDNAASQIRNRTMHGNAYMHSNKAQGGYGPGDGTGNADQPQDGTGYGPGAGTEDCDGTGPQGTVSRRGKRVQPQN